MASEILPYGKSEFPSAAVIAALSANGRKNETSNLRGWMEEAAVLLEKHSMEILGWNRKMSATLAHLKQAYTAIGHAETQINSLQNRITALETLATTDDLTGLKNRRGFREGF